MGDGIELIKFVNLFKKIFLTYRCANINHHLHIHIYEEHQAECAVQIYDVF